MSVIPEVPAVVSTIFPVLRGEAATVATTFLEAAASEAVKASCLRSLCGAVVVVDGRIVGGGHNSLPGGAKPVVCLKEEGLLSPLFKSDRTCCVHAEVRAITNAMKNGEDLTGAAVYFTRVSGESGEREFSGRPYCTICSKFALDVGLGLFVLEHDYGIVAYPTKEYNDLSFAYGW